MEVLSRIAEVNETGAQTGKRLGVLTYVKSSNYFSRYNGVNYYYNENDGKYVLATRQWLRQFEDYTREVEYEVKEGDTYDTISLNFYNNPTYYWIICDYNRIIDPLKPPKKGTKLIIPSLDGGLQFESSGV